MSRVTLLLLLSHPRLWVLARWAQDTHMHTHTHTHTHTQYTHQTHTHKHTRTQDTRVLILVYVKWRIHVCDMPHSYEVHDAFIHCEWHNSVIRVTLASVQHDSFICLTWLIQCVTSPAPPRWFPYMWQDSFIYVTWLIHTVCVACLVHTMHHVSFGGNRSDWFLPSPPPVARGGRKPL